MGLTDRLRSLDARVLHELPGDEAVGRAELTPYAGQMTVTARTLAGLGAAGFVAELVAGHHPWVSILFLLLGGGVSALVARTLRAQVADEVDDAPVEPAPVPLGTAALGPVALLGVGVLAIVVVALPFVVGLPTPVPAGLLGLAVQAAAQARYVRRAESERGAGVAVRPFRLVVPEGQVRIVPAAGEGAREGGGEGAAPAAGG